MCEGCVHMLVSTKSLCFINDDDDNARPSNLQMHFYDVCICPRGLGDISSFALWVCAARVAKGRCNFPFSGSPFFIKLLGYLSLLFSMRCGLLRGMMMPFGRWGVGCWMGRC
jgi:hypothetical protein